MQNRRCEDDDDEEEEEEEEEDTSCEMFEMCARRIQDCWRSHQNRKVFQLLMRTVCSAEACLTPALLQQLSPQEANLLRDPSLQCKVRFRFAGPLFPPVIVFKVFHTGRGGSYLSGKKLFQPSNQATADTCRMMGNRKFMNLMMEDENHWQGRTIWHPAEVMCTRDYMQREWVEVFISEAAERWRRKGCGGRKGCGSDLQGLLQVPGCPTPLRSVQFGTPDPKTALGSSSGCGCSHEKHLPTATGGEGQR
ncbi:uncharacterized protein CXorf58 homolog isoform X4 [Silurus meridionalis]|uniref:uncharacterized protein CXorf58 homolog isoform X4 n=1 Tax=Silurus meridionalis TaxID=175797 RepID=UPI001EECBA59|nr:uncharacterized protein CXorf58 homolog isoform X4 [Silurus meridionalis]